MKWKYWVKKPGREYIVRELEAIQAARKQGLTAREALRPKHQPGSRHAYGQITWDNLIHDEPWPITKK